ncbi:MAG: malto-oligosyltrehalose synthase [Bacteroidota bacterium]
MYNPISTYRVQFHKGFSFSDLEGIIPYLAQLGVRTVYASPIMEAVPGSMHGYDSVNPNFINPEIGTDEQFKSIKAKLGKHNIGWLQDIVPNHMAFHEHNLWLWDVLEKGEHSEYAKFFDTCLSGSFFNNKLILPFLGNSIEKLTEAGELKAEERNGKTGISVSGSFYPLNLFGEKLSAGEINADTGVLLSLLAKQAYELAPFRAADTHINYRRFFIVNNLICLNIQRPEVFTIFHETALTYVKQGLFNGLRVDHIDGQYAPEAYLQKLRDECGNDTYITVEKILVKNELLPGKWPVQGNTGYDFLSKVNNLLTYAPAEKNLTDFYKTFAAESPDLDFDLSEEIHKRKAYILNHFMQGELESLYRQFIGIDQSGANHIADAGKLKQAIGELLICCPVYRYFGTAFPLTAAQHDEFEGLIKLVQERNKELNTESAFIRFVLLEKPIYSDDEYRKRAADFYSRLMQFSGPLMAKGVEDTAMYTYNRFIGHNEVGGSQSVFGISRQDFHAFMQSRKLTDINSTATHDTKRGEDVRARLNVITGISDEWIVAVKTWQNLASKFKVNNMPDANDEYFIYQTLTGSWPDSHAELPEYRERLKAYLEKALRESKRRSNYTEPNTEYEKAAIDFTLKLTETDSEFYQLFSKLQQMVSDFGKLNSLIQVLLKHTCPGIPDTYQGCELYDLSLVDPDNRRPVDYAKRAEIAFQLRELIAGSKAADFLKELWRSRADGKIKLWLSSLLMNLRSKHEKLFSEGEYLPLEVSGRYSENILAFARRYKGKYLVAAVPLHLPAICKTESLPESFDFWSDTKVILPAQNSGYWKNLLDGSELKNDSGIPANILFKKLPLGLLLSGEE